MKFYFPVACIVVLKKKTMRLGKMGQEENTTEKRLRKELTEKNRYTLELCLKHSDIVGVIFRLLGFHPKTILREIVNGTVTLLDTNLLEYISIPLYNSYIFVVFKPVFNIRN